MDSEQYHKYLQSDEWKKKAYERMKIDGFTCQSCGCRGTVSNVLEVHHVSYADIGHEDTFTQLVTLCHCCHKNLHRAMERITSPNGRRGWLDSPRTPKIHVFTLTGADIFFKESEI